MVKKIILLFLVFPCVIKAQEGQYIHKHLTRGTLTFSTGAITGGISNPVCLTGNLEYYLDNKVSVRGDGFFKVADLNKSSYLGNYGGLLSGIVYHPKTNNHIDPFIGLQMGLVSSEYNPQSVIMTLIAIPPSISTSPAISPLIGLNYYANKWFHITLQGRYLKAKHLPGNGYSSFKINDISFQFGLGFNLF